MRIIVAVFFSFFAITVLVSQSANAQNSVIEESEFVISFRALLSSVEGASEHTQEKLLIEFRDKYIFQNIEFSAVQIISLYNDTAPFRHDKWGITGGAGYFVLEKGWGNPDIAHFSGEYDGKKKQNTYAVAVICKAYGTPCDENIYRAAKVRRYNKLRGSRDLQETDFGIHATVRSENWFHNLREGQKVDLTLKFLGLEGDSVYGDIVNLKLESKSVSCDNGHEYAPSAGYKFCPIDGLPLN